MRIGTAPGLGPFYQGRFKSFPVQTDEHFLPVARYVERNALRAKLVTRAEATWHGLCFSGRSSPPRASRLTWICSCCDRDAIDSFKLMDNALDMGKLTGEARVLFDHAAAQAYFGASVFWLRRLAALGAEEQAIAEWQIKRDGTRRGIETGGAEMIANDTELKVTLERIAQFQEQVSASAACGNKS